MSEKIKVGITHGDINGVGYEIIARSLGHNDITDIYTPVIFGYPEFLGNAIQTAGIEDLSFKVISSTEKIENGRINLVKLHGPMPALQPGKITGESGHSAAEALEAAVDALKKGQIDVLVTAPISKEAIQNDKFLFPGHTEYLEDRLGNGEKALMILCDDKLRVALVSTHLPVADIASRITEENVENTVRMLEKSLRKDFGIHRPKIAVLSLNPHCGDGGLLGKEENEIIIPVIEKLREEGLLVFGPYASDGFFGNGSHNAFDGVLAMYHDQGLAPFKTIAGQKGVNFTAGLPYVRTSPDHGTAFDIAWKGEADETSMREAIYKAIDIFRNRKIYEEISRDPLKITPPERHEKVERHDKGFRLDQKSDNMELKPEEI